jgi:hypothetical protein
MRNLEDLVARLPDGTFDLLLLGPDIDLGDVIQTPHLLPEGLQISDVLIAGFRNPHHHIRHGPLPFPRMVSQPHRPYTQLEPTLPCPTGRTSPHRLTFVTRGPGGGRERREERRREGEEGPGKPYSVSEND